MTIEIKVPTLPESIADATVATWHKQVGDPVSRDENIVDLETDKVMLEVPSPVTGTLKEIRKNVGDLVNANEVIAIVEEGATETPSAPKSSTEESPAQPPKNVAVATPAVPKESSSKGQEPVLSPSARRAAAEHEVDVKGVQGTGKDGRITKENVIAAVRTTGSSARPEKRVPMTRIRARIAERLLEVSQSTAMLTTFNEVNLKHVIEIRNKYKDKFEKMYNVRLGFMSFFVKAAVEALKRYPLINASIDGNDIVYHGYFDIGVAVSTERGLVVPVLRDADQLSMAEIESEIADYAAKARAGKLSLEEMQGGTFTITNGGVFGSLLSTPILNSPQSAILGMHKIEERPIVENGEIVIRPMMYLAMSYDHRIIDGKDSVTFLLAIKELLEDPARVLLAI